MSNTTTQTNDSDTKRFATLKARYALAGHTLHQSGPGYTSTRWGMVRYLPTLDDAEKFLVQIGGSHE